MKNHQIKIPYKENKSQNEGSQSADEDNKGRGGNITHVTLQEDLDIQQGVGQHIGLSGLGLGGDLFN